MKRVAILYICTGVYSVLWKEFYSSFEELFLPDCSKEYFVFTDSSCLECDMNNNVHKVYQEALEWPYPTLLRFEMFLKIEEELREFDYIYFFNANAKAICLITQDMVLPRKQNKEHLVVVKHPCFNKSIIENPYDRNCHSKAFIPYGLGKVYVQACILGGDSKSFLKMTKTLCRKIRSDMRKNVIALWHDESHVNRYILFRRDYRLLGREFSRLRLSSDQKDCILMRPKENYFDIEDIKSHAPETELSTFSVKLNEACKKVYKVLCRVL